MEPYHGARYLAQDIGRTAPEGKQLEAALWHYANHPTSPQIRELYKEIPVFLRDLLNKCSREYTREPS